MRARAIVSDEPAGAPRAALRPRLVSGVAIVALVGVVAAFPLMANPYAVHVFVLALFAVGLAVSYRPLLVAGQVSLAHGSFYAVGAYAFAILVQRYGVNFWLAELAAGFAAAVAAAIIGVPSLRTAGAYFFLITFACSQVITSILQNSTSLTGGFAGIAGIPYPLGITNDTGFFYLAFAACVACVAVFAVLQRSRWGLELRGLGASVDLAQAVGVSRFGTLLLAFGIGAFFAGIFGGLYAGYIGFIAPQSFDLTLSVSILTAVIVGGVRYIWGGVLGAAFITLVPLLFNWQGADDAIFASLSVIVVLFAMRRGIATEVGDRLHRWLAAPWMPVAEPTVAVALPEPPLVQHDAAAPVVLSVRGLTKTFGGVRAVRDVSFDLHEGETLGLIGPNGSGKTTTFNLISGFLRPDAGDVQLRGSAITTEAAHRVVRHGLTRSFQASAVFDQMSVYENVLLATGGGEARSPLRRLIAPLSRANADQQAAQACLREVGLLDVGGAPAESLSYGQKKVLGVAVGLATRPHVLCLDEPAAGMTDAEIDHLVAILRQIRFTRRIAIIIIEHRLAVIQKLCDRVIALRTGEILAQGTPEEVFASADVVRAFLGEAES